MENAPDRTTNYQVERSNEQSPNRKNVRVGPRAQTSEKTTNNRATELDMCMDGRLDGQLERAGQPRTSSRRGRVGPRPSREEDRSAQQKTDKIVCTQTRSRTSQDCEKILVPLDPGSSVARQLGTYSFIALDEVM